MNTIKLNAKDIERFSETYAFQFSLLLARMINNLRANHRQYIRIHDNEESSNIIDRIETIFQHGAIVYESIKTLIKNSGKLNKLDSWTNSSDVRYIKNQYNSKSSFNNKYLSVIRNEIVYHYDFAVIAHILENFPLETDHEIAKASSSRSLDFVYTLIEDVQLYYLLDKITEKASDKEKWNYFQEELFNISDKLVSILNNLVIEILSDNVLLEET